MNWRKSSHSEVTQCVEVGTCVRTKVVHLRDSKNPDKPHLHFTPQQFGSLLRRIKAL